MNNNQFAPGSTVLTLESSSGLRFRINANGSIRYIEYSNISVNLFLGNELEGGFANLFLRRTGHQVEAIPLLGPLSSARLVAFDQRQILLEGQWDEIAIKVQLTLDDSMPVWFWQVTLENKGRTSQLLDLIYAQDLGLAEYGAIRNNEYYVSQYLDHVPLEHSLLGWMIATRQNLPVAGKNPWTLIGSLSRATSYATDALQFYGLNSRAGQPPLAIPDGLPGQRLQHEHAMASIQTESFMLEPGAGIQQGFFGWVEANHPDVTTSADLSRVDSLRPPEDQLIRTEWPVQLHSIDSSNLFSSSKPLFAEELSSEELTRIFGQEWRNVEHDRNGQLLSFFTGERSHIVLKAKELGVLRPHGHILRTGDGLKPDESGLTSTVWMAGVFHSMVTQGHVNINRFLSTTRGYLGLFRSHGQRLFVRLADGWRLLDEPSAFEMTPEYCRWVYRSGGLLLEVIASAATDHHELGLEVNILSGDPCRFLLTSHIAMNGDDGSGDVAAQFEWRENGVFVKPIPDSELNRRFPEGGFNIKPDLNTMIEKLGGDELLFLDGKSRNQPFLCLITAPSRVTGFRMTGELIPETKPGNGSGPDVFWQNLTRGLRMQLPSGSSAHQHAARMMDILPWFVHDALVHFLNPRGLEQFSGGGWGTRDVTQGPVELLLGLGFPEPLRDMLITVFRNQNTDGDWPQWFMFFDREKGIRPGDSHGDIVFWPLLALGQYILATGDSLILKETLPFFAPDENSAAEQATILSHVKRALELVSHRLIKGTHLVAYGHGDWNDSLQPADPSFREKLCSAWTVTLHYQTLKTLAAAFLELDEKELTSSLEQEAAKVLADFQRLLIVDDVLTGFAHFSDDKEIEFLLHPRDQLTGLSYSSLAMIHAIINGMFTTEQAQHHLALIEQKLLGPDGIRLFDRPIEYRGGTQRYFQRAETSSYFGREIGLMYTHAHLRYAEALWRYGDADKFFMAVSKVIPIDLDKWVLPAVVRQANCYFSSSDAAFADRYEASKHYDRLLSGDIPLEGGWRVYSSGAGIAVSLLFRRFLGIAVERSNLVIDPVMPKEFDGLQVEMMIRGLKFNISYQIEKNGYGPKSLRINGRELPFTQGENCYRVGGAELSLNKLQETADKELNQMSVFLG